MASTGLPSFSLGSLVLLSIFSHHSSCPLLVHDIFFKKLPFLVSSKNNFTQHWQAYFPILDRYAWPVLASHYPIPVDYTRKSTYAMTSYWIHWIYWFSVSNIIWFHAKKSLTGFVWDGVTCKKPITSKWWSGGHKQECHGCLDCITSYYQVYTIKSI